MYRWATDDGRLHAAWSTMLPGEAFCGHPPPPYKMSDPAPRSLKIKYSDPERPWELIYPLLAGSGDPDPPHLSLCEGCFPLSQYPRVSLLKKDRRHDPPFPGRS